MKEQTPMQKLIEWIEQESEHRHISGDVLTTPDIIAKAKESLPEERKAFEDAWDRGVDYFETDRIGQAQVYTGKDYFTDKYGQ